MPHHSQDQLQFQYERDSGFITNAIAKSSLPFIEDCKGDAQTLFEAFQMDKYWNEDKTKLTVAFTAEKIHQRYLPN